MARVPITVMGYRCDKCGHEWLPKKSESKPRVCPKCHSAWWDESKEPKMTYEQFRTKIEKTIRFAPEGHLTWTEIRTTAKLPQLFPNNRWVRKMEQDIGLERNRDSHGIILWSLRYTDRDAPKISTESTKLPSKAPSGE